MIKTKLLEHKERQKKLFEKYEMKWKDTGYVFLNKNRNPFVAESLSDPMQNFRDRNDLEYMTVYGLRHSFATFCREKGMEPKILMVIMGHAEYNTTVKYYVGVSIKMRKRAMADVYNDVFYQRAS